MEWNCPGIILRSWITKGDLIALIILTTVVPRNSRDRLAKTEPSRNVAEVCLPVQNAEIIVSVGWKNLGSPQDCTDTN